MTPEVADHKKLEEILIEMKNRRVFLADVAEMLLSLEFFRARRPDDDSSSTFLDAQLRASGEASDGVWQEFILQWSILPGVTEHLEQVRRSDDLLRAPRTWFLILLNGVKSFSMKRRSWARDDGEICSKMEILV